MSGIKIAKEVVNDFNGWYEVLQKTLATNSYKKFFEVTSQKKAIIVKNDSSLFKFIISSVIFISFNVDKSSSPTFF